MHAHCHPRKYQPKRASLNFSPSYTYTAILLHLLHQPSSTITPHHRVLGGWRWPRDEYRRVRRHRGPQQAKDQLHWTQRRLLRTPRLPSSSPHIRKLPWSLQSSSATSALFSGHFLSFLRLVKYRCFSTTPGSTTSIFMEGRAWPVPYSGTARGGFLWPYKKALGAFPYFSSSWQFPPASSSKS